MPYSFEPTKFVGPGNSDPSQHFAIFITNLMPNEADILAAGEWMRGEVRDRTLRDESFLGGNFIPYTEKYAKQKGQQNVDLRSRYSQPHMLDALATRVTPVQNGSGSIQVGIFGNEELASRAKLHNEGGIFRTRQGTGKHPYIGKRWGGMGLMRQKRGGQGYAMMPRRDWLGARMEDLDTMRRIILNSIYQRIAGG